MTVTRPEGRGTMLAQYTPIPTAWFEDPDGNILNIEYGG